MTRNYRRATVDEFVDGFKFEYNFGCPEEVDPLNWMSEEGAPQGWIAMELPCTVPYLGRFDKIPVRILQGLIDDKKIRVKVFANEKDWDTLRDAVAKVRFTDQITTIVTSPVTRYADQIWID